MFELSKKDTFKSIECKENLNAIFLITKIIYTMKNRNKILFGIGLGLLAGGAAGYYLASEDGQKMQKKARKKLKDLNAEVQQTLKERSEMISSTLDEVAQNTKSWVNEVSDTVKNKILKTTEMAEDVEEKAHNSFKKGMEKAKINIMGKMEKTANEK